MEKKTLNVFVCEEFETEKEIKYIDQDDLFGIIPDMRVVFFPKYDLISTGTGPRAPSNFNFLVDLNNPTAVFN